MYGRRGHKSCAHTLTARTARIPPHTRIHACAVLTRPSLRPARVIRMASSVDCYAPVSTGNVILGSILTAGTFIAYVPQVRRLPARAITQISISAASARFFVKMWLL